MKNWILIFLILGALSACKSKKPLENQSNDIDSTQVRSNKEEEKKPKDANKPVNNRVEFFTKTVMPLKFDQVKITSKIDVETGSFVPTLNATIYIENNQKIWANLSAFINVARAKATPEGFKAIDKINRNYIDSDYEYLNNLLNVNFIDYKAVEKILMGRTFIRINDSQFILTKNAQGFKMVSAMNQKIESDGKTREYKIALFYNDQYDLLKVQLEDTLSPDELEISYDNWDNYGDIRLPKNVKIIIKGTKTSQVLIENTKFDFSKMETPYSVPSSYKKIEIND